jgi:hypothetical protein
LGEERGVETYLRSGLVGLQLADVEVLDEVWWSSATPSTYAYERERERDVPFLATAETVNDLEKVGATRRA